MNRDELIDLSEEVGLHNRRDIAFLIAQDGDEAGEYIGLSASAIAELRAMKRRRALEDIEAANRVEALERQLMMDAHNDRAVRVLQAAGAPLGEGKVGDAFIKKPRMGLRSQRQLGGGVIRPPTL